jgi:hypothetical protein
MKTTLLLSALVSALVLGVTAACSGSSSSGDTDGGSESCPPIPSLECASQSKAPTYTADVAPIIQDRCAPCHFAGGIADAIVDLSTYSGVDNASMSMLDELTDCAMPPVNGNSQFGIAAGTVPGLTEEQLTTLVQWIECQMPK